MYLPNFGIDLREHFRKPPSQSIKSFSPATQAVVIFALLHKSVEGLIPSELSKKLGYTQMTMTRALDEFQTINLGEIIKKGKERRWYFRGNKYELWKQARSFMKSPLKYRTWLSKKKSLPMAGLSALAQLSLLNEPSQPVFAISLDQWRALKKSGAKELPSSEGALIELEIWSYDPNLFAKDDIIDPFSLYLSLEENKDERIETALEQMMEKVHDQILYT